MFVKSLLDNYFYSVVLVDPQIMSEHDFQRLMGLLLSKKLPLLIHSNKSFSLIPNSHYIPKSNNLKESITLIIEGLQALRQSSQLEKVPAHAIALPGDVKHRNELKVMLVDDSALMKLLLHQEVLKKDERIQLVAHASNGQEALQQLNHHSPDVILLDLEMPVMDGLSFLRAIQGKHQAKILVLSSASSSNAQELRLLGVEHYIDKPRGSASLQFAEEKGSELLATLWKVANMAPIRHSA